MMGNDMTRRQTAVKAAGNFAAQALKILAGSCSVLALSTTITSAQQREITNPGFENNLVSPPRFLITDVANAPDWQSTNGTIEIWRDGYHRMPSQTGDFHIELNPFEPVGLYQEVCLLNGEALAWDFWHAARGASGGADQTAVYEVVASSGTVIQALATNTVSPNGLADNNNTGNDWVNVTGNTAYTGPTGIQRLQFSSTNPGSYGNFLDNINVELVPTVTLSSIATSAIEGGTGPFPSIVVGGEVPDTFTVTISVVGGTATEGTDFTLSSTTVTIPAGSYDGTSAASLFAIPLSVPTDSTDETDETIILELSAVSAANPSQSPAIISSPGLCNNDTLPQATHTIIDFETAPVANNDSASDLPLGVVASIDPIANDTDAESNIDAASVVLTGTGAPAGSTLAADGKTLTVPGEGVWSVNIASGAIEFTPEATYTGDPTPVAYTVADDDGNVSNEAVVTLEFQDPPAALNDVVTSASIAPVTIDPLSNDSDADGTLEATTVVLTGSDAPAGSTLAADGKTLTVPGEGEWTVDAASGAITFTPEAGFSEDPTPAIYTVDDNDGNTSNPASVTIAYGTEPVAVDDTATSAVIEPVTIDPLANDADSDGTIDPTTVVLTGVGAPTGSTLAADGKSLTVPGEGMWTVDPASGEITFTPDADYTGDPTPVEYNVSDDDGNTSNPATVTLEYTPAPVVEDDVVAGPLVGPVTLDPLANDNDLDGTIDPTTVALTGTGAPAGAILAPDGKTLTVPGEGVWTVDPTTGEITFTPEDGFTGNPTPVAYTVADDEGNVSEEASVTITFGDRPVATDDVANSATLVPVTLDLVANDSDPDGTIDPTTVILTGAGSPAGTTLSADGKTLTVPDEGVWTADPTTGALTFTPETGFSASPTPVVYTVNDDAGNTSNEATATVSYGEPPVAEDDAIIATASGPVSVDPLGNDTGGTLDPASVVLTGTGAPTGATLSADGKTLTVPGEGTWSVDPATGVVTFTPDAGFSGSPTPARYTVADTLGNVSNEASIVVTIEPPVEIIANNDGPIGLDGSNGGTSTLSVLDNDTLDGLSIADPALVTLTALSLPTPASGSITLNPDGTVTAAVGTTAGTYTLVYEICETDNSTNCATAEVELVVVEAGTGLIAEIEEDLESILSEDLTNTLLQQSNQIGRYSSDALDRLQSRSYDACLAAVNTRLDTENILFDVDRAVIRQESYGTLDEIASILIGCPGSAFEIAGHTDSDASDAYNLDLSQRRVVAVLHALTERGVDTTGFIARGYGESQPIASNATQTGKAQNRRVEFRSLEAESFEGPCDDGVSLTRALDANTNSGGSTVNGSFVRDAHDCITDRREVFEGSLSYLDTETGQTQSAINLSYRREQYRGAHSVFGYFVGLYGSQSDVTNLADGEIRGFGLNAGVFGANRLQSDLFVDYYLGAAAGRHSFDLAFDRDIGTIDSSGDYQYFAGFAGAALSGQVELGETKVTPRIGFDYVYTPGADVDAIAELGALSDVGTLELDAISGGRIFAEIRTEHEIQDGAANLWVNPRIACYQSLGSLDGVCGFGGSIGIASAEQDNGLSYAFEVDGEWGEDYSTGSLSMSVAREVGLGVLSGDAGVGSDGAMNFGGTLEVQF